jgi:hypothetical protein
MIYDIIIVGSGMAGLYTAYTIQKMSPNTTFLILEKHKKQWIGGRTSNEMFYGTEIVTGAGIGRKKDKLLYTLLGELDLHKHGQTTPFTNHPYYSKLIAPLDIKHILNHLKDEYTKYKGPPLSFKTFAKSVLGEKMYQQFLITIGYTDYEHEDAYETLFSYGMEDNICCLKAFHVPWRKMVMKLYEKIGASHFKFSNNVAHISNLENHFLVETENNLKYTCNKVVLATTISSLRNLLPNPIYKDIEGQPFLRLYGKFSKKSIPVLKEYIKGYTCLPGPLQKIIPMNPDTGVYMIAYSDNANAVALKDKLKNTEENRDLYCRLLERSLGMPEKSLQLIALKDFYWPIGTHYYKPLNKKIYKTRDEFIDAAQHPEKGILVVGEVVSRNQGWTESALESVKAVISKKWINE